ncbi:RICIN domain-containing protein [Streptomyces sp. NPDC002536]
MPRTIRAALAVGASIAALVGGATSAYADQFTDTYTSVRLQAEHSGKCLTIENARIGTGANAVQQPCAEDLDSQIFKLRSSRSGTISVQAKHSGRCLAADRASRDVTQLWCSDGSEQRWQVLLVEVAKDLYELRPVNAPEYCLTIPYFTDDNGASSQADGSRAGIYPCNGASNKRWRMLSAAS